MLADQPKMPEACYLISFISIGRHVAVVSTKALVQRLKEGDQRACAVLVQRYQGMLLHEAVYVFSLPLEDAEEIVSDVLLAVVRGIDSFTFQRGENDFHVWVLAIFRNKVRDYIRRQAINGSLMVRLEDEECAPDDEGPDSEPSVVRTVLNRYREALVQEEQEKEEMNESPQGAAGAVAAKLATIADALERLETWERVLLRCRAVHVPYEEIATYTGKSVAQLKVYHARVKRKFVHLLAAYYPELRSHDLREH